MTDFTLTPDKPTPATATAVTAANRALSLVLLAVCILLTACDKLSDNDDTMAEILPGTWAFSYQLMSEEDTGLSFNYDHVIFRTDGTVSIVYPNGQIEGTYRAGSAAIRIEGQVNSSGEQQVMLWQILTFSDKRISARYQFEFGGQSVAALVTLDKTDSLE